MFVASGGLVFRSGWQSGQRGGLLRLWLFVTRFVAFWALAAAAFWWLAPTLFVGSREGLQTALQVLPAVVVAVLVLILGSAAVVAQLASSQWGTRAPVMITMDDQFQQAVLRPVLLLIAVLLMAGQVPDSPAEPREAVTAIVTALAVATVVLTFHATILPVYVIQTVAPHNFPRFVVQNVTRELEDGSTDLVVLRTALLGEMLKQSLRREDSIALGGTLGAIVELQEAYLAALPEQPSIRSHQINDGSLRHGWLAEDLEHELVAAAELGLRDMASATDVNAHSHMLRRLAGRFIEEGQPDDALPLIRGLVGLGTSAHQITPTGVINWHGPPAEELASLEHLAEDHDAWDLATYTLAGWALVTAYPVFHLNQRQHPLWLRCILDMGDAPPWEAAIAKVRSPEWKRVWGNKQYQGDRPVVETIKKAKRDHAHRPSP